MNATAIGILVSVTAVGVAAVWRVANFFRDRPTRAEINARLEAMGSEQKRLDSAVTQIEIELARQGVVISNIDKNVEKLLARYDTRPIPVARPHLPQE